MKERSTSFAKSYFQHFAKGVTNIFIFLPYYFSVLPLLKTLLKPWKNLTASKTAVGFSVNEWFSRIMFNLISRLIGLIMRLFILFGFMMIQSIFLLTIPVLFLFSVMILPIAYLANKVREAPESKQMKLRSSFIKSHCLRQEHEEIVSNWFNRYYELFYSDMAWWKLDSLLSIPPLARDWSAGFTPTLDIYTQELTTPQYQSRIRSAIDREEEIRQIETILTRNQEANVILVGEEGVGKQTIIDAMAKKIYNGDINPMLVYKRILKLNLEKILTEYTDQKQREERLEELFQEAQNAGNIIILIEKLDKYTISTQDRINLTTPFEKYGNNSNLHFIATSTPFDYQKYIFPHSGLTQLFVKTDVYEIKRDQAEQILLEKALFFEKRSRVIIPYETVKNIIDKSDFFITNIPFPEKAIELLDSTIAYALQDHTNSKDAIVVLPEIIDKVLKETVHVPTQLDSELKEKLVHLEEQLTSQVLFQVNALHLLTTALQRSFLQLGKRSKPLASFLFLGPTGVGKTETAKALTRIFFDDEKSLLRFDMSLYQSKSDIGKLIGQGDSGDPGVLTEAIRQTPYGVLLLDEIEKADHELLNIFLTILDEGYFTDGFGRRVDCKNLMVIATSNAGSDYIFQNFRDNAEQNLTENLTRYLIEKKHFSPEFLNRFDGVIAYKPLSKDAVLELARRIVKSIVANYEQNYRITITISDETLTRAIEKGFRPEFGARDLERTLRQEIEDQIAMQILNQQVREGQTLNL